MAQIDVLRYARWFDPSLLASVPVPVLHVVAVDLAIASPPQNGVFALASARTPVSSFQAGIMVSSSGLVRDKRK